MLNYKNFQKVTFNNDGTELYTCAQICSEGTFNLTVQNIASYCCQTDNCDPPQKTVTSCLAGFYENTLGFASAAPCESPNNKFCQVMNKTNTLK